MTDLGVMIDRCSLDSRYRGFVGLLRMLLVLISGTQTKIKATEIGKNGVGKTTNMYFTVILKVILLKEGIWSESAKYNSTSKKTYRKSEIDIKERLVFWP